MCRSFAEHVDWVADAESRLYGFMFVVVVVGMVLGLCEGGSVWVFVLRVCAYAAFLCVMRVAANEFRPQGGQCVAASLSVLTGLRTLNLGCTGLFLLLLWGWFWDCVRIVWVIV